MAMAVIWTVMVGAAILCGLATGRADAVAAAALEGAGAGVELCLSMAGALCLWMGVMEVMRRGGLARGLSRLLRPALGRLYPDFAREEAVMDAVSANVSANLLGLGNAATPLGLEAARRMARHSPGVASDSLCMLVVCNTASIQLIPATVASLRAAAGCQTPFDILPAVWLTSALSVTAGILAALLALCVGTQIVNSLWITLLEWIVSAFGLSVMETLEGVSGEAGSLSMFLYMGIFAPLSEEILFRGLVLETLRPYGKRFAIFGSAVLFGLFHGNLLQTPYAFGVGLLLGYAAVEYSFVWAVVLHLFNNLVLADLLTRLMNVLPVFLQDGLYVLIFGGCFVASLVILGVKAREIREYNRSEWMDRRCLKCFFLNFGVLTLAALMIANMISLLFL